VQFDAISSISVRFRGDKLFRNPSSSYPGLYGMLAFGRDKRKFTLTAKPAMKMKMMARFVALESRQNKKQVRVGRTGRMGRS
jgi:hypothetical protein